MKRKGDYYSIYRTVHNLCKRRIICEVSGCWLWSAHKDKDGYPLFNFRCKTIRVSRLIAFICLGYDLKDNKTWVLHKCDVSGCWNPAHLYLGTAKQNSQDRERRRRGRFTKTWVSKSNVA